MKVGLIARTEDRGLGNLTWEWAQHMRPERVLIVEPRHPVPQRPDRYDEHETITMPWDPAAPALDTRDERRVRKWLTGLDVVYSAETFYDWRICAWARELGVRTVCHVMPEFYRHWADDAPPAPSAWWAPTLYRLDRLPAETRHVPVPVALERFRRPRRTPTAPQPITWLHPAGTRAAQDRNGTRTFLSALRYCQEPHTVIVRAQGQTLPTRTRRNVDVVQGRPADEYWQLYDGAEAVVLPRRYAGLSLPAQEAMAAGCALLMTDVEPQRSEWPICPLPVAGKPGSLTTAAGEIPVLTADPRAIAMWMDNLARDRMLLAHARKASRQWAEEHSWEQLGPAIEQELEAVISGAI